MPTSGSTSAAGPPESGPTGSGIGDPAGCPWATIHAGGCGRAHAGHGGLVSHSDHGDGSEHGESRSRPGSLRHGETLVRPSAARRWARCPSLGCHRWTTRMPDRSAGILLYRRRDVTETELLLVHPGGPYWKNKDEHAWSIPKGEYRAGDDPERAAEREFAEELGQAVPTGSRIDLGEIRQSGGKRVRVWAVLRPPILDRPGGEQRVRNRVAAGIGPTAVVSGGRQGRMDKHRARSAATGPGTGGVHRSPARTARRLEPAPPVDPRPGVTIGATW